MTTEPQNPGEHSERISVRRSLARAAAYGIGPFKKRVRLQDPAPYEEDGIFTSFTMVVQPQAPVWNYKGKLADNPLAILKAALYAPVYQTTRSEKDHSRFHILDTETGFIKPQQIEYAFAFSRNGMSYQVRFRDQDKTYAPYVEEFSISEMEGLLHFYRARPMTKQEAEYALEVIEAEYPYDQHDGVMAPYHATTLDRLRNNLPKYKTAEEAKANSPHSKLMKNENKHHDIFDDFGGRLDQLLNSPVLTSAYIGMGTPSLLNSYLGQSKPVQPNFNKAIVGPGHSPSPVIKP